MVKRLILLVHLNLVECNHLAEKRKDLFGKRFIVFIRVSVL